VGTDHGLVAGVMVFSTVGVAGIKVFVLIGGLSSNANIYCAVVSHLLKWLKNPSLLLSSVQISVRLKFFKRLSAQH